MRDATRPRLVYVMAHNELVEARLTYSVIGAFFEVYNHMGFGFFESVYANALEIELKARGHRVAREVAVEVIYKGHVVGLHRIDMIVDEKLVVESKASLDLPRAAGRQVRSYLHATYLTLALLLHFGPSPRFFRFLGRDTTKDPINPQFPDNQNRSCS